jgi:hypothetical protein
MSFKKLVCYTGLVFNPELPAYLSRAKEGVEPIPEGLRMQAFLVQFEDNEGARNASGENRTSAHQIQTSKIRYPGRKNPICCVICK